MWSGHGDGVGPSGKRRDVRLILNRATPAPVDSLDLRLAEDLKAPGVSAWLEFKVTGLTAAEKLAVTLNGKNLSERQFDRRRDEDGQSVREGRLLPAFDLFRFPLRDSDVKFGDNRLSVGLNSSGKRGEAVVQEIEVMVQTPAAEKPSR